MDDEKLNELGKKYLLEKERCKIIDDSLARNRKRWKMQEKLEESPKPKKRTWLNVLLIILGVIVFIFGMYFLTSFFMFLYPPHPGV